MRRENVGQIRIIEAFLAAMVIFSSLAISTNFAAVQNDTHRENLASAGLQCLLKLDSEGKLSMYIDNGNWTALRDCLSLALPAGVTFNLTVYDELMQSVNTEVLSNGGFSSQEIAFVDYTCASQGQVYHCYVIYLYLAVAG